MIFVQIFRPPPSDKKNYVSKMPQKQEKMSFKNVWKKMTKSKKFRHPLKDAAKICRPPSGVGKKLSPPFRVDGFRSPHSPVISRPPTPEIMSLP